MGRKPSATGDGEAIVDREVTAAAAAASASSMGSSQLAFPTRAAGPRRKWSESHGQAVLRVKPSCQAKLAGSKLEDKEDVKSEVMEHLADKRQFSSLLGPGLALVDVKSNSSDSGSEDAKVKKERKD